LSGYRKILDLIFNLNPSSNLKRVELNFAKVVINDHEITNNQNALLTGVSSAPISQIPDKFELFQNYPNPFNSQTTIKFSVPNISVNTKVVLKVYNIEGKLIRTLLNETRAPGSYSVAWDGCNETGDIVATGMYLYEIRIGEFKAVKKMLVMK